MIDIVEKLREYPVSNCGWGETLCDEAADEIERLRMCIATMPECDLQFKTEEEMTRWNYWKSQFNGLLKEGDE